MGLLARTLTGSRGRSRRAAMPGPLDPYWYSEAGMRSGAGVMVTPETALRLVAVYACCRVIAETLGSLPNKLRKITGQDDNGKINRELAVKHPLFNVLLRRPNRWQTPIEFYEMLTGHCVLRGNGYAEIVPGLIGAVDQLVPLHPARMRVQQLDNGELRYIYKNTLGKEITYRQDQIFHLRGWSSDGIIGMNPIAIAREALGLALATERFGARAMHNNATPNGMVIHPSTLSDKAYARLRASMRDQTGGIEKAGNFLILEEGMKWQQVGLDMEDLQFLETRKMNKREICSLFRVPPHMIGDLEGGASYASVDEMGEDFVGYTLRPWFVRWEQAIARDLIDDPETYDCEFDDDCLLRGKQLERFQAYQIGRQAGFMSANDVREKEGWNSVEGGDEYSNPATTPGQGHDPGPGADGDGLEEDADSASPSNGKKKPPPPAKPPEKKPAKKNKKKDKKQGDDEENASAAQTAPGAPGWLRVMASDAAKRIAKAEVRELAKRPKQVADDPNRLMAWATDFYEKHEAYAKQVLESLVAAADKPPELAAELAGQLARHQGCAGTDFADLVKQSAALIERTLA